jgi:hypothetical protein
MSTTQFQFVQSYTSDAYRGEWHHYAVEHEEPLYTIWKCVCD